MQVINGQCPTQFP